MDEKMIKFFEHKGIDQEAIPKIPLYMDQLLSFFDGSLEGFKRSEDDVILTKTMVNNYVKSKVLEAPVKKKYDQNQMMKLAMIYQIKNILSIGEIKQIMDLRADNEVGEDYKAFVEEENNQLSAMSNIMEDLDLGDEEAVLEAIISLVIESSFKKRIAERLLDYLVASKEAKETE